MPKNNIKWATYMEWRKNSCFCFYFVLDFQCAVSSSSYTREVSEGGKIEWNTAFKMQVVILFIIVAKDVP